MGYAVIVVVYQNLELTMEKVEVEELFEVVVDYFTLLLSHFTVKTLGVNLMTGSAMILLAVYIIIS